MLKTLARLAGVMSRSGEGSDRTSCRYDAWQRRAQQGELKFHRQNTWRPSARFMEQTASLFEHFGFHPADYAGQTVLDLGAGSKLRTRYFRDARLIAVEPLADRFRADISWCDLDDADAVYSTPAEELLPECVGQADLVISINVLDHCYDFAQIIANITQYAKPGGLLFLSFDKHLEADEMHPLELDEAICEEIFTDCGLAIERQTAGFGDSMEGDQTYGHGPYALNYWLRRPAA